MFSKSESKKLREDFWISFGKSFPRKWTLYNTKIKDFSFKLLFDTRKARVLLAIEDNDPTIRMQYYNKMLSLKNILLNDYLPEAIYQEHCILENHKEISCIYVEQQGVCIHNKDTWQTTMEFLYDKMSCFESFWEDYKEVIVEETMY